MQRICAGNYPTYSNQVPFSMPATTPHIKVRLLLKNITITEIYLPYFKARQSTKKVLPYQKPPYRNCFNLCTNNEQG